MYLKYMKGGNTLLLIELLPQMPYETYDDFTYFINDLIYATCKIISNKKLKYNTRLKIIEWEMNEQFTLFCKSNNTNMEQLYNNDYINFMDLIDGFKVKNPSSIALAEEIMRISVHY
jgi:hypothetical protein